MSLRECDKCGEMVDEAKAFCPGCGHALVEEAVRTESTEFNLLDGTMKMGDTMYNQMLSDMGLSISAHEDKTTEVIQAAVQAVDAKPEQVAQPVTQGSNTANKWLIIGGITVLLLLIAVIVIGWVFWSRIP
jgi:hypothetical protein